MKNFEVELNGKRVSVTVSDAARRHLSSTKVPTLLEVELYFSCLIKKSCHFNRAEDVENTARVMDGLYLKFRASMTRKCAIDEFDKEKADSFPIVNQRPYIPNWVKVDFAKGQWAGEFGYAK